MDIKPALTFEKQVSLLEKNGCRITDKNKVLNFLRKNNYYKVSGYFNIFENYENKVLEKIEFEKIIEIFQFDRELMNFLHNLIGEIEGYIKTQFANYLALNFNSLIYMDKELYKDEDFYYEFIKRINDIKESRKDAIIEHHNAKYNGNIPIWVMIEYFSLGNISKFYSNLKYSYQKKLSKNIFNINMIQLSSWLKCLTDLRNRCAHYERVYNKYFINIPKNDKKIHYIMDRTLFSNIMYMKYIYNTIENGIWDKEIRIKFINLINKYKDVIELKRIGFPENWKELL